MPEYFYKIARVGLGIAIVFCLYKWYVGTVSAQELPEEYCFPASVFEPEEFLAEPLKRVPLAEQSFVRYKWTQDWSARPNTLREFLANPYFMQRPQTESKVNFRNAYYRHSRIDGNILRGKTKKKLL